MGNRLREFLVLAFVVIATGSAVSQEEKASSAGAGWVSCAEFGQSYQQSPKSTEDYFFAWAQGYMSGRNHSSFFRKDVNGLPRPQQKQHIRSFCAENPLSNYLKAVDSLYDTLPNR